MYDEQAHAAGESPERARIISDRSHAKSGSSVAQLGGEVDELVPKAAHDATDDNQSKGSK